MRLDYQGDGDLRPTLARMADPLDPARESLRTLVTEALDQVVTSPEVLAEYKGGTAAYHPTRDQTLLDLRSFGGTVAALGQVPSFERAFGPEHAARASLQFVYHFLGGVVDPAFDEAAFETAFGSMITELDDPVWTYVAFANLRNFHSDDPLIDFGDGITIRHRSHEEIEERLRWTEWHFEELNRDWMRGHAASGHVVWVETQREKSPETAILSDSATGPGVILDLFLALWLFASGDLTVGAIFTDRAAKFDLSGGGLSRSNGMTEDVWGMTYSLSAADAPAVREIYDDVVALRKTADVPANIWVAVRRFSSVYSRDIRQREDRIIDELIALEALAGSGTELRFRLAFRISSLLAESDAERVALFEAMKGHYDLRSKIVHGSALNAAQQELVKDDSELRSIVRRVVRGVIRATVHTDLRLSGKYIDEKLDAALLDGEERGKLRVALGLPA